MQTEQPTIIPQSTEPAQYGPVQTPPQPPPPIPAAAGKPPYSRWIIAAAVLVSVGAVAVLQLQSPAKPQTTPALATPTPTLVPVPTRPLSAVATTSAFLEFEAKLDEVTRGIQNAPIDNQSLFPPTIDLPLGF